MDFDMQVKLISITQSLLTEKPLTAEELIVYIARVSNPSNQLNTETAVKLLTHLIRNKHWSPFEMVDMTVEITTSRAIAQQILRHRSFSFQEFSQRYAAANETEPIELRYQANSNRQSSTTPLSVEEDIDLQRRISTLQALTNSLYQDMLNNGVARECARFVLPLATQTRIYMKGSVRSWIHYLQVRLDPHTQLEHQRVATAVQAIFTNQFPNIQQAMTSNE